jgi:hypothetical protein
VAKQSLGKGTYIVDALASGGSATSPHIFKVMPRAYSKTNSRGHSTLPSQKTRSWPGVSLGISSNPFPLSTS